MLTPLLLIEERTKALSDPTQREKQIAREKPPTTRRVVPSTSRLFNTRKPSRRVVGRLIQEILAPETMAIQ
jgi:hypothetical protein